MIWLASYPKSGNTWVRAFLGNYIEASDAPIDINSQLAGPARHLDRHMFDEQTGLSSADFRPSELDRLRTNYHGSLPDKYAEQVFAKVHDAYLGRWTRAPLFPAHPKARVVYIVRNPLDIVPSYAHHGDASFDKTIRMMNDQSATIPRGFTAFAEYLGGWSQHVHQWTSQSELKKHVLRYEDLLDDPIAGFSKLLKFCGFAIDPEAVKQSVNFSSFDSLKQQESTAGFQERQFTAQSFFRKGRSGDGLAMLRQDQIDQVIADHGEMMERFGYMPNMTP